MEQLKPTSVADYRKGRTMVVQLDSGKAFEIRKMPVPVFAEMYDILEMEVPAGTPLESIEELMNQRMNDPKYNVKVIKAVMAIIPHCVVNPPIKETSSENALSIDDIDPPDMFDLFGKIMDFSGISKMAEDMRKKFRLKPTG